MGARGISSAAMPPRSSRSSRPLGSYGGPTQTVALLPGSPAIGAGSSAYGPTTDQRGVARGASVDIGAFQTRGFAIAVEPGASPQSAFVNASFANPLAVVVSSPFGDPVAGGVVHLCGPTRRRRRGPPRHRDRDDRRRRGGGRHGDRERLARLPTR